MKYQKLAELREALAAELTEEIHPMAMNVEHHKLVEMRLQTLLMAEIEVADDVKKRTKDRKDKRVASTP